METSTKYNGYAARIPKGTGLGWRGGGSLSFDVWGRGVLPNSDPFGQAEKGGRENAKIGHFSGMS